MQSAEKDQKQTKIRYTRSREKIHQRRQKYRRKRAERRGRQTKQSTNPFDEIKRLQAQLRGLKSSARHDNVLIKKIKVGTIKQIPDTEIDRSQETVLGEGVFGVVKLRHLYLSSSPVPVAVKCFRAEHVSNSKKAAEHEALILQSVEHPVFPMVYGITVEHNNWQLVMEYRGVDGSSLALSKALKVDGNQRGNQFVPNELQDWIYISKLLADAIAHLHQKSFLHCDLKKDNILLSMRHKTWFPSIVDFGKAKLVSQGRLYNLSLEEKGMYRKKYPHIAPEVVQGKARESTASDVFSLGKVLISIGNCVGAPKVTNVGRTCVWKDNERRPTAIGVAASLSMLLSHT